MTRPYNDATGCSVRRSCSGRINLLFILAFIILLVGCGEGGSQDPTSGPPSDVAPIHAAPLHTYYVATNGDDASPGTIDKPFKTWAKAWSVVAAGDLVYIRGGIYYPDPGKYCSVILKGKSGAPGKYIRFFAFPGETPVLDCSKVTYVGNLKAVDFTGDYCHFRGLEISGVPQPVDPATGKGFSCMGFFASNCNNNVFENIFTHHNGGSGYILTGNSKNNLILNSDFHHNYDPNTYSATGELYSGGNADGCAIARIPKGCWNIVSGCRFWWNSDDGIDLWENEGIVTIQNCWSFWNGYQPGTFVASGDGNGFKFGQTLEVMDDSLQRIVKNCVAYANRAHGFDQNSAYVIMALYNNTSYQNGSLGFILSSYPLKHLIKNNISYTNYIGKTPDFLISGESEQTNNSWNGFSVTDADFLSLSSSGIDGARMSDGLLPNNSFLKLVNTSGFIDKGIDIGLPYSGKAPDLGAFEAK